MNSNAAAINPGTITVAVPTHWWSKVSGITRVALHRRSSAATDQDPWAQHPPTLCRFLEQASLAREMRHL